MRQGLTPVVKALIIINVLIFVVLSAGGMSVASYAEHTMLWPPDSGRFEWYQLLTHAFRHDQSSIMHLAFNMLGLYFLGPTVERRLGSNNFMILYFLAIAGAVIAHLGSPALSSWQLQQAYEAFVADPSLANFDAFFNRVDLETLVRSTFDDNGRVVSREAATVIVGDLQTGLALGDNPTQMVNTATQLMREVIESENTAPMLGASGAVSGVVAGFAVLYPNQKLYPMFLPFGLAAKYFVPIVFGIDLALGVFDIINTNIAHFAHVGGAITGALIAYYFSKTTTPPWLRRIN